MALRRAGRAGLNGIDGLSAKGNMSPGAGTIGADMQSICVSVVVPVYRDGGSVEELWSRMRGACTGIFGDFELILIDDGSPDDSWAKIEALSAADARVKGIRLSRNYGQHPAIAAGFDHVKGDVIVLMDADLEDRPEDIPELVSRLGAGVDIAYTTKKGEQGKLPRRLTSNLFHQVFSRITRTQVPLEIGTLRAFTRKVLDAIHAHREHNVLFGPLMISLGFTSVYVPVLRDTRETRPSTYSFRRRLMLAMQTLMSYTDIPHRLFMATGSIAFVLSVLYSLVIVIDYLFVGHRLPPGLTLIALLIILFMGLMLMALGIIGSYVFRVYQEVLARPRYLVSEKRNLSTSTPEAP
jgi:polyisoprenyl-phosphate glycosyltransferase